MKSFRDDGKMFQEIAPRLAFLEHRASRARLLQPAPDGMALAARSAAAYAAISRLILNIGGR